MKMAFILKLYSLLALSLGLFIFATCGEQAFIATAIALMGGAFAILTFTQPSARYMQEGGDYVAYMEKDGHEYRITKDGAFVSLNGQWLVSNRCPSAKVANKVRGLNEKQNKWVKLFTFIGFVFALIVLLPGIFPSALATPKSIIFLSYFWGAMSFLAVVLGASAVVAVFVWAIGGVKATIYTNPLDIEFHVPELPEIAAPNADFAVIATIPGEKTPDYLKRVKLAKDNTALLVVAPKGASVWIVETPNDVKAIDRTKGSKDFDIDPVQFPQIENENEYRRGLASAFSGALAYFGTNNRIAERVASSSDPLMEVAKQTAFCFAILFATLPVFAQNNTAQALDYLGESFEQVRPKGAVLFHFKKLTIATQGDGQKTYRDLLTHSTQFNDAGAWGKLEVVVSNGRVQGRQMKQEPITAMEKPKYLFPTNGESARPIKDKGDEMIGSLKTYYSTAATQKRIQERETAVEQFSQEYGDNIRRDFLSMCLIPLKYLFWFLALIGAAFWVASHISAKESAIFSNGIPIFGTIQNWVHGWSSGVLYLIVMLYAVVYVLYSTLAWIIPIEAAFIAIPAFIGNVAITASVAHRIIPNKRVRGGQNFTGGQAPGQRQIGM